MSAGADEDATRRTWLANERTWLAWVRTGLTATAVALAIGRITPDLADAHRRWPYAVIGAGYGLLGALLVAYGFTRRRDVERAISNRSYVGPDARVMAGFATLAVALGLATVVVVVVG